MTDDNLQVAYCPSCGSDYQVVVSDGDSVKISCDCGPENPEKFIEELESQLPMDSDEFEKINKRDPSRGFQ